MPLNRASAQADLDVLDVRLEDANLPSDIKRHWRRQRQRLLRLLNRVLLDFLVADVNYRLSKTRKAFDGEHVTDDSLNVRCPKRYRVRRLIALYFRLHIERGGR